MKHVALGLPIFAFLLSAPLVLGAQVASITTLSTGPLGLANPQAVAVDSFGNIFIADTFDNRIIMATPSGSASVVAGLGSGGFSGDGLLATNAQLSGPTGIAVSPSGAIYVADTNNNRVRKFTVGGTMSTAAGTGAGAFGGDGGPATSAQLNRPTSIALDSAGTLYITDSNNNRIRMVAANGTISTVAGTGTIGFSGDGGAATSANLSLPSGITVDPSFNIFFGDGGNRVRKFTVGGNILTVAGGGPCCGGGDGGPATGASLNGISGLAADAFGNLAIADTNDNRLRVVLSATGFIFTVDGTNASGNSPNQLNFPRGVGVDSHGNLYVADSNNNRVQKIVFFQGSVSLTSASSGPGTIVQVALTLNLNPAVSIDSLGVTVQLSAPAAAPLTFTPASGISPPNIPPLATNNSIVLAWNNNLASAAQPVVAASMPLGTIGVSIPPGAALGNVINISVTQVAADLTGAGGALTSVPLAAGPIAAITVQNCSYLVGDAFPLTNPLTNNHCGQFGDNQLTFEDVIISLRVWGGVVAVPVCSDLFDALNAGPPNATGGPLTLQDVQVTLNRWGNLDASRPRRLANTYLQNDPTCPAGVGPDGFLSGGASLMQTASRVNRFRRPVQGPVAGAVELGGAEVRGDIMRAPLYVRSSQPLTSLGVVVGWSGTGGEPLRFETGPLKRASLLDADVPGKLTLAWFESIPAAPGQPFFLGYVTWARGTAPARLQILTTEARGENGARIRLENEDEPLQ